MDVFFITWSVVKYAELQYNLHFHRNHTYVSFEVRNHKYVSFEVRNHKYVSFEVRNHKYVSFEVRN